MRTLVTTVCALTLVASAWLGVMFAVLHLPGFERGVATACLFVLQSMLALAVTRGWVRSGWWRRAAVPGALGLIWAGWNAAAATLSGPHFEGYVLLISLLLTSQGILTLLTSSSKVHQFGN